MTAFEKARIEIEGIFDYLNSIYGEDLHPKTREIKTCKFPLATKKRVQVEVELVPGFFESCSEPCKAACVGMCYGLLYLDKYHCKTENGICYITVSPDRTIKSVWEKLNIPFPCDKEMTFYNQIESLLRPARRSYFSDIEDKCLFSVGYEFRDGLTRRQVTEIFEDGNDIMVAHECISPESAKKLSRRVVTKEEDLVCQIL